MKLIKTLFLLTLPFFLFTLSACDNAQITNDDLSYESEFNNLGTTYIVRVKPNYNFKNLNITFTLIDNNGKGIYQETISKNDLHKNQEYIYTLNYSLLNTLKAEQVEFNFDGKIKDLEHTINHINPFFKNMFNSCQEIKPLTIGIIILIISSLAFIIQKKQNSKQD